MFTYDAGQIIEEMEVPESNTQTELSSKASWSVENS